MYIFSDILDLDLVSYKKYFSRNLAKCWLIIVSKISYSVYKQLKTSYAHKNKPDKLAVDSCSYLIIFYWLTSTSCACYTPTDEAFKWHILTVEVNIK